MIKDLEKQIKELFIEEGIGKCIDRFLNTTKNLSGSEEEYEKALKIRLRQGGKIQ